MHLLTPWLLSSLSATLINAYSFTFDQFPVQCGVVNVSITGSGGTPPYRISIIPFGGSPLNIEVRRIMDLPFNDSSSVTFNLPYPTNSTFVAVVSDKNGAGFGSGGTTVGVNVEGSSDNSCLPTSQVAPDFTFSSDPLGSLTTCQSGLLNWDSSKAQGTVNFWGVIPGGDSFTIPAGTQTTDQGSPAISWTPDIRPGVDILVVAGDNRGFGTGGSFQDAMQPGAGSLSCINNDSPISTPGSPAGGSYPTNALGDRTSPTTSSVLVTTTNAAGGVTTVRESGSSSTTTVAAVSNKSKPIGPIVGGVVGGIVGLLLICLLTFFLLIRRRNRKRQQEHDRPVDLLQGRDGPDGPHTPLAQQYIPAPYYIPRGSGEMTEASRSSGHGGGAFSPLNRQWSGVTSSEAHTRLSSEEASSTTHMGMHSPSPLTTKAGHGPPSSFRPVYQHEDGGKHTPVDGSVEIPPAYNHIKGESTE